MRIVRTSITLTELTELAEDRFGDLVKAVIDLDREVMAVGEGMHADEEAGLLADGSRQADLVGDQPVPCRSWERRVRGVRLDDQSPTRER